MKYEEIDVTASINMKFEQMQQYFQQQIQQVRNPGRYIEIQLSKLYDQRYAEIPPQHVYFEGGISMRNLFDIGWDLAERGLANTVQSNFYVWLAKEEKEKIKLKFGDDIVPEDYNRRLNKLAIEEYINGAASSEFYNWLLMSQNNAIETKPPVKRSEIQTDTRQLHTLKDLFLQKELFPHCVKLLQETEPPTIDVNLQYIGASKGVVLVWYDALKDKGFFEAPLPTQEAAARLLMATFKGYTMNASLFRKNRIKAEKTYKKFFEAELGYIKSL